MQASTLKKVCKVTPHSISTVRMALATWSLYMQFGKFAAKAMVLALITMTKVLARRTSHGIMTVNSIVKMSLLCP